MWNIITTFLKILEHILDFIFSSVSNFIIKTNNIITIIVDKHFWKIEDKISQTVMASHKFTRNKPYNTVLRHFALFRIVREKRPSYPLWRNYYSRVQHQNFLIFKSYTRFYSLVDISGPFLGNRTWRSAMLLFPFEIFSW